ncbi:hypothetical protein [Engelhardtia mirabilis]
MLELQDRQREPGFVGALELRIDGAHYSDATCSSLHGTGIEFPVSVPFERISELEAIVKDRRL